MPNWELHVTFTPTACDSVLCCHHRPVPFFILGTILVTLGFKSQFSQQLDSSLSHLYICTSGGTNLICQKIIEPSGIWHLLGSQSSTSGKLMSIKLSHQKNRGPLLSIEILVVLIVMIYYPHVTT